MPVKHDSGGAVAERLRHHAHEQNFLSSIPHLSISIKVILKYMYFWAQTLYSQIWSELVLAPNGLKF